VEPEEEQGEGVVQTQGLFSDNSTYFAKTVNCVPYLYCLVSSVWIP
jgi:hypothetical protein